MNVKTHSMGAAAPAISDAAVARAMRSLEDDIVDLKLACRVVDYFIGRENTEGHDADGKLNRVSFTPAMFELISFLSLEVVRRSRDLDERYTLAYRGEVFDAARTGVAGA